jgi:hypothetical protein
MVEAEVDANWDEDGNLRSVTARGSADEDVTNEQIYAAVTAAWSVFVHASRWLDAEAAHAPDHVPDDLIPPSA